ncbi:MAG TPA: SIS domain-containing protein [Rhizomicrobium sp.]|nr:SIS domain-containing protein [Rhizomicrobium sp.]
MNTSAMAKEAKEAPERVQAQLDEDTQRLLRVAAILREFRPKAVVTCARGSSDHAATYARYLIETRLGLLTASASPSVSSVYGVRQELDRCLFLVLSQSGRSPDLLAAAGAAKDAGALVVALVNHDDSPLAQAADHVIPLRAGPETSVAATKSYICALTASLHLVAHWSENQALLRKLRALPAQLGQAWLLDWQSMVELLTPASNLFVLGRGLGLAVAQEAALKLKETCGLHAEAFSGAEVRHGPMALLKQNLPALMFVQNDETREGMEALARDLSQSGARVLVAGGDAPGMTHLPTLATDAAVAPILFIQSFYRWVAELALARGFDPDRPPHLKKVTETF